MVNLLVPKDIEDKFIHFSYIPYDKIENYVYSHFWDIVVVENGKDAEVALQFKKLGTFIINVGEDRIDDLLKIEKYEIDHFFDLLIYFMEQSKELDALKKNQDLLFEPLSLNAKMASAYKKLSRITSSRTSIVIAREGLLEDWILSKTIGPHELFDFSVIQEEEILLNLFGSKNHLSVFLEKVKIVLMNCDLCSPSVISKTSIVASNGLFSPYASADEKNCNAKIVFHFQDKEKVPQSLYQIAGKNIVEIPSLKEISDDLPTIFRFTISALAQKRMNVNFNLSEDVLSNLKKFEWKENWTEFFRFCNSFLAGEVRIKNDLEEVKTLPAMKDYLKMISDDGEKQLLKKAMELYNGDKKQICEALKINYKTLIKKMKLYGLKSSK